MRDPHLSLRVLGRAGLSLAVVGLLLGGCDGGTSPAPTTPTAEAEPIFVFHEVLTEASDAFDFDNGEFHDDFGDGAFFGVGFYVRSARDLEHMAHDQRAQAANDYNVGVLKTAAADPLGMLDILEEVFMATLGAIEYAGVSGDHAALPTIQEVIDVMDAFAGGLGDYLEISAGDFALDLYGPTSSTAGLALIHLQHAHFLTERRDHHITRGKELVAAIDAKAWDADKGLYRYRPEVEDLYLYPNATMMTVLARLHQLTGDDAYKVKIDTVFAGIAPLRKSTGYYQSPYSQAYQGAQTDEYGTLSAQNYLTLGLLIAYETTGEATYFDEAIVILDFVRDHLWDEAVGKLLHHWIDGRAATTDDPDYFCSGCNMQYLYIAHYLKHTMGWEGGADRSAP